MESQQRKMRREMVWKVGEEKMVTFHETKRGGEGIINQTVSVETKACITGKLSVCLTSSVVDTLRVGE